MTPTPLQWTKKQELINQENVERKVTFTLICQHHTKNYQVREIKYIEKKYIKQVNCNIKIFESSIMISYFYQKAISSYKW